MTTSAHSVLLAVATLALLSPACMRGERNDQRANGESGSAPSGGMMDRMKDRMPDWMMSNGMMGPEMMRDMGPIHSLLTQHEKIERTVEEIPGGIRAATTSADAEVADQIRTHAWQMKERIEQGKPIRMMDPLFREIFRHYQKIRLEIEDIPDGVRVTETSDDPQVTLLIRQHAKRAVSEFVSHGMKRAMRPTPLPEGYQPQE